MKLSVIEVRYRISAPSAIRQSTLARRGLAQEFPFSEGTKPTQNKALVIMEHEFWAAQGNLGTSCEKDSTMGITGEPRRMQGRQVRGAARRAQKHWLNWEIQRYGEDATDDDGNGREDSGGAGAICAIADRVFARGRSADGAI
jgi:hypothetical protein